MTRRFNRTVRATVLDDKGITPSAFSPQTFAEPLDQARSATPSSQKVDYARSQESECLTYGISTHGCRTWSLE